MDLTLLDQTLAIMLNDPDGKTYPATMRARAEALAVRTYSRFIAYKRRYGTGALYSQGNIGDTQILTVGGPFAPGAIVTLDPMMPWQETFTVTSVSRAVQTGAPFVGTPVALNLSAPLANFHPLPTVVTQASLGLAVVANQDTYVMPYDFLDPDTDTFDQATGARRWVKRQETFYDGVYLMSGPILGVDYGMAQNFTGAPGYGWGFAGVGTGTGTPAIGPFSTAVGGETQYIFIPGDATTMQIIPTPIQNTVLDFQYIALHQPSTIPDADLDALCDYAQALCYEFWSAYLGGLIDFKEDYITEYPSQNTAQLKVMAQNKKTDFDNKVRQRPYCVSG